MSPSLTPRIKFLAALLSLQSFQLVWSARMPDIMEGTTGNPYASNRWSSTFYTETDDDADYSEITAPSLKRKPTYPIHSYTDETDVHTPHGESWVLPEEPARKGDWKATNPARIGGYDNVRTGPDAVGLVSKISFGKLCRYPRIPMFHTFHEGFSLFKIYTSELGKPEVQVAGLFSCGLITNREIVEECKIAKYPCTTESGSLIDVRPGLYHESSPAWDLIPIAACNEFNRGPPSPKLDMVCTRSEIYQGKKYNHIYWCIMRTEHKATDCVWNNEARYTWRSAEI
ncbi:hypothetical protein CP533_3420 [Ophiocordyceps camponoti-saundersi (nom. inval.)]|nr:hypothetical protein CP533_3420 [Ophiocordyceps camponoti-saundersi (nom. inval.)]